MTTAAVIAHAQPTPTFEADRLATHVETLSSAADSEFRAVRDMTAADRNPPASRAAQPAAVPVEPDGERG